MKYLRADQIEALVRDLCVKAATELPGDVAVALLAASRRESSPLGCEVLGAILRNAELARKNRMPLCQDTGLTYVFLEVGQDLHIDGDIRKP